MLKDKKFWFIGVIVMLLSAWRTKYIVKEQRERLAKKAMLEKKSPNKKKDGLRSLRVLKSNTGIKK